MNSQSQNTTGSGIYAGRFGALKAIFSETAMAKVLIAKVPNNPRLAIEKMALQTTSNKNSNRLQANIVTHETTQATRQAKDVSNPDEIDLFFSEDVSADFTMAFLNFSQQLHHDGAICKDGICCHYSIDINRSVPLHAKKVTQSIL